MEELLEELNDPPKLGSILDLKPPSAIPPSHKYGTSLFPFYIALRLACAIHTNQLLQIPSHTQQMADEHAAWRCGYGAAAGASSQTLQGLRWVSAL